MPAHYIQCGDRVLVKVYVGEPGSSDWILYDGTLVEFNPDAFQSCLIELDAPAPVPEFWDREGWPDVGYRLYRTMENFVFPADACVGGWQQVDGVLSWVEAPGVKYGEVGPWDLYDAHERNKLLPEPKKKSRKTNKSAYAG